LARSAPRTSDTSVGDPGSDGVDTAITQWRRERPDLDPSPMAIFGRIARIFALSRREQARVHQPFGLTHAAFDLLANLRRSGRPHRKTASALAKSSMISTGGVTFRLDGLEDEGLIRRIRDSEDRRIVTAELTEHGLKTIDEAIERHLELFQDMLAALSATEQRKLAALLSKLETSIAAHLQRQADEPDGHGAR
jgi:DNA-binding MarR family transcriptional regulator